MVDQLNSFAAEVTRVGQGRRHGGQARRPGRGERRVGGTWKDLTDNVNVMASNLTEAGARHREGRDRGRQRRPLAEVRARSQGRGRGAGRDDQQHDRHAARVRRPGDHRCAREVGIEGKLGAEAKVPGVAGVWSDLTDNVNIMASNLDEPGARHRRRW